MTVRIAIPIPTTADRSYNDLNWPVYAEAVRACGGEPIAFATSEGLSSVRRLATLCDGVLLPGSPADVGPSKYGQLRDAETAAADAQREALDETLLEHTQRYEKPLLAVCFGVQMLNVWLGGTLVQDLIPFPVNHSAGRSVAVAHSVTVLPGSLLAELAGATVPELKVGVNSSHHQAVGLPGESLRVTARCPEDGVVEAVERLDTQGFLLGVQWHPERTFASSSLSRNIFARFLQAAGVRNSVLPLTELRG